MIPLLQSSSRRIPAPLQQRSALRFPYCSSITPPPLQQSRRPGFRNEPRKVWPPIAAAETGLARGKASTLAALTNPHLCHDKISHPTQAPATTMCLNNSWIFSCRFILSSFSFSRLCSSTLSNRPPLLLLHLCGRSDNNRLQTAGG